MTEQHARPQVPVEFLAAVRAFVAAEPAFKFLGTLFQVEIIIDANIVISDLLWLTRRRKSATARTKRRKETKKEASRGRSDIELRRGTAS